MKKNLFLTALFIISSFISCNNIFKSTITEKVEIRCLKDNADSQYKQIQKIVYSIDKKKLNNNIRKEFNEINPENFDNITFKFIKREREFTNKTSKVTLTKTINKESYSIGSYYLDIEISIEYKKANSEQALKIMGYYKKFIKKELLKNNINPI